MTLKLLAEETKIVLDNTYVLTSSNAAFNRAHASNTSSHYASLRQARFPSFHLTVACSRNHFAGKERFFWHGSGKAKILLAPRSPAVIILRRKSRVAWNPGSGSQLGVIPLRSSSGILSRLGGFSFGFCFQAGLSILNLLSLLIY